MITFTSPTGVRWQLPVHALTRPSQPEITTRAEVGGDWETAQATLLFQASSIQELLDTSDWLAGWSVQDSNGPKLYVDRVSSNGIQVEVIAATGINQWPFLDTSSLPYSGNQGAIPLIFGFTETSGTWVGRNTWVLGEGRVSIRHISARVPLPGYTLITVPVGTREVTLCEFSGYVAPEAELMFAVTGAIAHVGSAVAYVCSHSNESCQGADSLEPVNVKISGGSLVSVVNQITAMAVTVYPATTDAGWTLIDVSNTLDVSLSLAVTSKTRVSAINALTLRCEDGAATVNVWDNASLLQIGERRKSFDLASASIDQARRYGFAKLRQNLGAYSVEAFARSYEPPRLGRYSFGWVYRVTSVAQGFNLAYREDTYSGVLSSTATKGARPADLLTDQQSRFVVRLTTRGLEVPLKSHRLEVGGRVYTTDSGGDIELPLPAGRYTARIVETGERIEITIPEGS